MFAWLLVLPYFSLFLQLFHQVWTQDLQVSQNLTIISHKSHGFWNHRQLYCLFNGPYKEIINVSHHWHFVKGIHYWPVTPHKGPVMEVHTLMSWAVAGRRQVDFDIATPIPLVFTHAQLAGGWLCHFDEGRSGLGLVVSKQMWKIWCWTHLFWSRFCSLFISAPQPHTCEYMLWFILKPISCPSLLVCALHMWAYL